MKYWVLYVKHFSLAESCVYILDEGYSVWNFDIESAVLLGMYVDIMGIEGGHIEPAVLVTGEDGWYAYAAPGEKNDMFHPTPSMKRAYRDKGYLIAPDFEIYSPALALGGIEALVSESGDLLYLHGRSNQCIRVSDIAKRIVGGIHGHLFRLIIDETVTLKNFDLWRYAKSLGVNLDFQEHGVVWSELMDGLYKWLPRDSGSYLNPGWKVGE